MCSLTASCATYGRECEQQPHNVLTFCSVTTNIYLHQLPDELLLNSVSVAQMFFSHAKINILHSFMCCLKQGKWLCSQLQTFLWSRCRQLGKCFASRKTSRRCWPLAQFPAIMGSRHGDRLPTEQGTGQNVWGSTRRCSCIKPQLSHGGLLSGGFSPDFLTGPYGLAELLPGVLHNAAKTLFLLLIIAFVIRSMDHRYIFNRTDNTYNVNSVIHICQHETLVASFKVT